MPTYPKLRDDLISVVTEIDGQTIHTIKDPVSANYFRLREPEFWIVRRFDGRTSPEQLAVAFRKRWNLGIDAAAVAQFVEKLDRLLFLDSGRREQSVSRRSYGRFSGDSLFGRLLYIRIKAFRPGRFLDLLTALYRPFHHRYIFALSLIMIFIGVALLFSNLAVFEVRFHEVFQLGSLLLVILAVFSLVATHEFAHAVICRHLGGDVREMGFLLMYFQPCVYCDLSDAWLFPKKSHRLAVTFAGLYFQILVLGVAVIVWRLTVPGSAFNSFARLLAVVSWMTFFFNFNPLIKLDGYYLLSDWLDIPNLRSKSFGYFANLFKRRLLGWPVEAHQVSRREGRIYIWYSMLALVYSGLLLGFVLWLVGGFLVERFGGGGFILLIVTLLVILRSFIVRIGKGIVQHAVYMKRLFKQPWRLAAHVAVIGIVLVAVWTVPLPHHVSGEVTVQPLRKFTLSVNEFGLLESRTRIGGVEPNSKSSFIQMVANDVAALNLTPMVLDGQFVRRGDTIAILSSNQIERGLQTGRAELERLEGRLSLLKAPPKRELFAEAEAEVRKALANLGQFKREQVRVDELVNKGLEANEKLETANSRVEIAEAELSNKQSALQLLHSPPRPEEEAILLSEIQRQQANLDFLTRQNEAQTIITPIDGHVRAGNDDAVVLAVSGNETIELLVPVSDFDLPLIQVSQNVSIKLRAYPDQVFLGEVVRVPENAVTSADGSFFFIVVLIPNDDELLREGMSGYAKIEIGEISPANLIWRKTLSTLRVEFWSWW